MAIGRGYMKKEAFLSRQLKLDLVAKVVRAVTDPIIAARHALARAIRRIDRQAGVKGPDRTAEALRSVLLPFFGRADTARIGRALCGLAG